MDHNYFGYGKARSPFLVSSIKYICLYKKMGQNYCYKKLINDGEAITLMMESIGLYGDCIVVLGSS